MAEDGRGLSFASPAKPAARVHAGDGSSKPTPSRKGSKEGGMANTSPPKRPRASIQDFTVDLSAALNDPRKGRQPDIFTRDWGESFVPQAVIPQASYLPYIGPDAFNKYRAKFTEPYKRHVRNVQSLAAHAASESSSEDEGAEGTEAGEATDKPPKEDQHGKEFLPEELNVIPKLFFSSDFDLANPRTFNAVMLPENEEHAKMDPRLYSRILQDKLSHYLDLVEVQLSTQISRRSERFFGAISYQEVLNHDVTDACVEIAALRRCLAAAQADLSHSNLYMTHLFSQRQNTTVLLQKLSAISAVTSAQSTVQLLLASSDYVGALDLISTTLDILHTDLTGIHALRHLGSQLTEIEGLIGKMMERELLAVLLEEPKAIVAKGTGKADERSPMAEEDEGASGSSSRAEESPEESLEDRLTPLIYGLLRQGKHNFIDAYKAEVETFLKTSVKQLVVDFFAAKELATSGQTANPQLTSWADSLRAMKYDEWLELLRRVFACLLTILERLELNNKCVGAVVKSVVPWSSSRASHETSRTDIGQDALDVAQAALATTPATAAAAAVAPPNNTQSTSSASPSRTATPSNTPSTITTTTTTTITSTLTTQSPSKAVTADDAGIVEEEPHMRDLTDELDALAAVSAGNAPDARLEELDPPPAPEATASTSSGGDVFGGGDGGGDASPLLPASGSPDGDVDGEDGGGVVFQETKDKLFLTPQQYRVLMDTGAAVVGAALEEMHLRCSKLVQARNRDGADNNVPAGAFIEFFKASHVFMLSGEKICNKSCPHLRGSVLSQAKAFMERFHGRQKEKLLLLLQNETWSHADVPPECQELVNMLGRGYGLKPSVAKEDASSGPVKRLYINDNGYSVVGSLLMFVKMIAEYCKCAQEMAILTADVLTKLFDILRFFNKQTCRLVLKAEALKHVGLKTITAKHLALSSQTLSVILLLIPCLYARCKELLPAKMHVLLGEFELITADFVAHRRDIYVKFVAIMDDVWSKCATEMTWSKCTATPGAASVASSTAKLHKALVAILPLNEIAVVFKNVLALLNKRFRDAASAKDIDKNIRVGMAADVVYYEEKFSELEGIPVEELRQGLADLGLVLPPFINKN